jgi:hypothetical protein
MKIKWKIVILAVLSCLLIYILTPVSLLQSTAYAEDGGSTIGGIAVSDLKEDELKQALETGITNWTNTLVTVSGAGTSVELDASQFEFNVDQTIQTYESQTDKAWFAFWKKRPVVHIPFNVTPNESIKEQLAAQPLWDAEATYTNIETNVAYLRNHEIEAVAAPYSSIDNERLSAVIKEIPSNLTDTQSFADLLNDRILAPGTEFSFLQEVDPLLGSSNRETISFVASAIYEAALKMNAQISERHQHQQLPSYLTAGLDANVQVALNRDLRFINIAPQPVQLKVTNEGFTLKVEFYAATTDTTATVRVNNDGEVLPKVVTRYTNDLPIGRSQIIEQGSSGMRITVYRTNNDSGQDEVVSKDYYPPTNKVILKSSRQPVEATNPDGTTTNPNSGTGSTTGGTGNITLNPDGTPVSEDEIPYVWDEELNMWVLDPNGSTGGSGNSSSGSSNSTSPKYDKGGNLIP